MEKAEQDGWTPRLLLLQDPSAEVEELLQKHKRLERCLGAQVEKISTLEATACTRAETLRPRRPWRGTRPCS